MRKREMPRARFHIWTSSRLGKTYTARLLYREHWNSLWTFKKTRLQRPGKTESLDKYGYKYTKPQDIRECKDVTYVVHVCLQRCSYSPLSPWRAASGFHRPTSASACLFAGQLPAEGLASVCLWCQTSAPCTRVLMVSYRDCGEKSWKGTTEARISVK